MRYVYRVFVDHGRHGMREETMIATSEDEASRRLNERGVRLVEANIQWSDTLSLLAHRSFSARDLAQVYRSLARRIGQGAKQEDALEQASSFVTDPVLKVALAAAQASVATGERLDEGLRKAEFPEQDAALVQAMSDAGGASDALYGLSDAYAQKATLTGKIKGILLQPIIYSFIGALMIWASFVFLIPRYATFFDKAGFRPPPGIAQIYAFDAYIQHHTLLASFIYWSVLAGLGWFLARSAFMTRAWQRAPILRDLLSRSDAAQALSAFALLYEAAVRRSEAARRIAESCRNPALRDAFRRFAENLEGGGSQAVAARRADFPSYLAPTLVGALGSNDPSATIEDLRIFAKMLEEDVEILSKKLETAATMIFLALTAAMVLGVFMVTVFPELAVTLSNA